MQRKPTITTLYLELTGIPEIKISYVSTSPVNSFRDHGVFLVSSEPLGLELVAERLNVEDRALSGLIASFEINCTAG